MKRLSWIATALLVILGGIVLSIPAPTEAAPSADEWNRVVDKAIAFVRSSQSADGSWGKAQPTGITGIVTTGLLQTGKVGPDDKTAGAALKYIEGLVNTEAGHIAGKGSNVNLQNYVTSINVMALQAANRPEKYKAVVGDAVKFLKQLQFDEGENKKPEDAIYGGAGYGGGTRPDLSNTQFFLEALKSAGVGADDPAMKKALLFVSRCQNFKSEFNDQPWAGKINDGTFIYTAANGGETRAGDQKGGPLIGYGSMTYAGIKSMIYCGVSKDDPRFKKAFEWIKKNYTVDANPGMPEAMKDRGLYYYYHTMAKTLDAVKVDELIDADGKKHDWRKDLTEALAKRQKPDGSWVNDTDRWMEGDPDLVTGYALMALSHCKPAK